MNTKCVKTKCILYLSIIMFPKSYQKKCYEEHLLTSVAVRHAVSGSTPVYPLSGDVLGSSQQGVQIRPRLTGYLPCLHSHKRLINAARLRVLRQPRLTDVLFVKNILFTIAFNPRRSIPNTVIEPNGGGHDGPRGTNGPMIKAFGMRRAPVSPPPEQPSIHQSYLGPQRDPLGLVLHLRQRGDGSGGKRHGVKNCHLCGV